MHGSPAHNISRPQRLSSRRTWIDFSSIAQIIWPLLLLLGAVTSANDLHKWQLPIIISIWSYRWCALMGRRVYWVHQRLFSLLCARENFCSMRINTCRVRCRLLAPLLYGIRTQRTYFRCSLRTLYKIYLKIYPKDFPTVHAVLSLLALSLARIFNI